MVLEYQKLEVASEEMDKWVEWMSRFGWNLKSSQRVFNRSSRPTGALTYENLTFIHRKQISELIPNLNEGVLIIGFQNVTTQ